MKIFETLEDYKKVAKIGDFIALEGNGLINGLNANCKSDFYKVCNLNSKSGFVGFKKYGGRIALTTALQQKVGLIDKKTYSKLQTY